MKRLSIGAVLAAGLLAAQLVPGHAYAHSGVCVSDPIVWLDNGMKVSLRSETAAASAEITGIHYTLHLPGGVQVVKVVYTQGQAHHLESLEVVNDQPAGSYLSRTMVSSTDSWRHVTASESVVNEYADSSQTASTSGFTNQVLQNQVQQ